MLIDLRELLSGSQDEKSYKADIEMNTFNTGSSDYDIIDKPAVDVIIKKLGKNKLSIKADSYVTLSIPCDRCLEPRKKQKKKKTILMDTTSTWTS